MGDIDPVRFDAEELARSAAECEKDDNYFWRVESGEVKNLAEAGQRVAAAYLAEHDETPVDAEFLTAHEFVHAAHNDTYRHRNTHLTAWRVGQDWYIGMGPLWETPLKTRGQLLAMVRGLGLEAKR